MTQKRFINDADTIVVEALDAVASLAADELLRLDGYPHIKVVLREHLDPAKVAVISGGGAGHEPAHAGFVGRGMLSAAVSGEIFASPSVEAVYAGIMAATGDAGCLLVVKNYTGDRLNFGLAAERARAAGKRVETVIVADDVAIPDASQPRGVAGTLFVHKIAGHLAEQGASLEAVAAAARRVAAEVRSLGVSLEGCTIPGRPSAARLADDEGELGLGIHGEPGVETFTLASVRELVALMVERLLPTLPDPASDARPLVALLNNLGAVPSIEMAVVASEVLRSALGPRLALVIGPAALMTSLDMNGFSLSLLPLDDERRAALTGACEVVAWPEAVRPRAAPKLRALPALSARAARVSASPSADPGLRAALVTMLDALIAAKDELDALDAKIGDGDTGSTMAGAARAILAELDALPFAQPSALLASLAELLAEVMGGSSGVLLSIFCTAAAEALARGEGWIPALTAGLARVREYGGASLGDRTMIDALEPAFAALRGSGVLGEAASAARAGAERTASMMRAGAGRAAYLTGERLAGVPDPGAVAVAIAFEALAREHS
ncbi:dihydroxyacetone kinase subunit DhaK [Pseudenhygromyxa sp. WMMC2535]|uniref:dihydroxyacetone kinase subunit DhaK n=1 Tax=Pseudenhygromyxa sp. WMMC2535 TaxID=2712867 RepID=UPI001555CCE5|nr:dihydroxyacetone kinase subunit DhaK [Pseudenhygromyxa sp. WMMC2535]NVB40114.1 dihydroxyacetone kinase subunit DhaK [Pseudenhygromyxa sp. WMMC2535]